jgi:hypothetical protein
MLRAVIARLSCRTYRLGTYRTHDEDDPLQVFDFLAGWNGSRRWSGRRIMVKICSSY